ncbi:plasmid replication protein RepC [Rhizobium terrae]|uniref:plasmid replication protein RepC n=1 Tax=Rhizobium terrae TaxID=2171756 RepID=UPI000E3CB61E|nr:plasmid replication protein RepC [Rhizobium terrae]
MESGYVTTPFGRRPMSFGMLKSQHQADTIATGATRNKWKLFRSVCEARKALGVTDRALSVLDALLTFYPDDTLSEERGLVVFPSNQQLSLRARGMTPATLRRHLAVLVEAGLITRKDSPNGKRYARRGREGKISEAFGFSLAPLLARAQEIERSAAAAAMNRELLRVTKEQISICRRDIVKLISMALDESIPGHWDAVLAEFRELSQRVPRTATTESLNSVLKTFHLIKDQIINQLEIHRKVQKIDANESQIERHKQDSQTNSTSELEPCFEARRQAAPAQATDLKAERASSRPASGTPNDTSCQPIARSALADVTRPFPLGAVLQACPQITDYGPGGVINNWRDLMSAAIVVRSMLEVSPSAYEEACSVMGPENAATVIACILERGGHISSAGGYLRDLTRRADRGKFAVGPMLMALMRRNNPLLRHTG